MQYVFAVHADTLGRCAAVAKLRITSLDALAILLVSLCLKPVMCNVQAALRRKPEWQKKLTQRISKHSSLPMQAR